MIESEFNTSWEENVLAKWGWNQKKFGQQSFQSTFLSNDWVSGADRKLYTQQENPNIEHVVIVLFRITPQSSTIHIIDSCTIIIREKKDKYRILGAYYRHYPQLAQMNQNTTLTVKMWLSPLHLLSVQRSPEFHLPEISLSSLESLLQTVTEKLQRKRRDEGLWSPVQADHLFLADHDQPLREKRVGQIVQRRDDRNMVNM